jgi:hypothetical protein
MKVHDSAPGAVALSINPQLPKQFRGSSKERIMISSRSPSWTRTAGAGWSGKMAGIGADCDSGGFRARGQSFNKGGDAADNPGALPHARNMD